MPSRRILRTNVLIRDELADLLRREVKDPQLEGMISITEVETAPDLSIAHVYVSVLGDEEQARKTVQRLRHAAGFFRRELAERLNLRHTPELDFRLDLSIARGARLLKILRELDLPPAEPKAE
jgi:ribosome-binding factor A